MASMTLPPGKRSTVHGGGNRRSVIPRAYSKIPRSSLDACESPLIVERGCQAAKTFE